VALDRFLQLMLYSLRDIVFGIEDSAITTLGVVIGVVSSGSSTHEILLAGAAAVIGGLISMTTGEYISTKSQVEVLQGEVSEEREKLRRRPEHELRGLERCYERHGFKKGEARLVVREFSHHKKLLLRTLLAEELGILPERFENPIRNATIMGIAYIIGGLLPLTPFVFLSRETALPFSVALSVAALFIVGAWKTTVTKRPWLRSGLEMLFIGLLAAAAGYAFGILYPGA
jgi:VIT1/CCC1 family predicted Fe2+/Mn2+ transporter